nr:MAG TPA: hypothetical protein [Caudoviricetes sp.]
MLFVCLFCTVAGTNGKNADVIDSLNQGERRMEDGRHGFV